MDPHRPDSRPVVAHFVRKYLPPTHSFVANQISSVNQFRPIVLCHQRTQGQDYAGVVVAAAGKISFRFTCASSTQSPTARRASCCRQPPRPWLAALRAHRAALIHFHWLVDARFFLAVKRLSGLPAVVSAYGYDVSSFPRHRIGRLYLQSLFGAIDLFLAMSQDMRRDLVSLGCPDQRIVVHYHGIDTRRFIQPERYYPDRAAIAILMVGRLQPKKGHRFALEALRLAESRGSLGCAFHVTLVGDGPERDRLGAQVATYGWQDKVTFAGHVPHGDRSLVEYYRGADIFALPSITGPDGEKEGIPGTLVEAMASGLPVVSSYHAGIPEVVVAGQEGLLVPEGNIDALADAFASLTGDRALRERLGRAAAVRAVVEHDLKVRTANLEAIYERLLESQSQALVPEEASA